MGPIQEPTNALSNCTIPTPYGLPFPKIGGLQPPCRNLIAIISETGKATDFKFGRYIHKGPSEQKPIKNFGKKGAWAYPGAAQFWGLPHIISDRLSYELQISYAHSYVRSKQKPIRDLGKSSLGHSKGLPKIFQCMARSSLRQHGFLVLAAIVAVCGDYTLCPTKKPSPMHTQLSPPMHGT